MCLDLGLMDYSLLIGVVRRQYGVVDGVKDVSTNGGNLGQDEKGAFHAATVEGPGAYHMGLIDILQEWNFDKKMERYFKIYFRWDDPDGLSAIEPAAYQKRFMERAVYDVFEGQEADELEPESATNVSDKEQDSSDRKRTDRRYSVTPISPSTATSFRSTTALSEVQSPMIEEEPS